MRYGSRRTVVAFRATTAVRFPLWANQSLKPQVPTHIPQGISTSGRATGAVHSGFRYAAIGFVLLSWQTAEQRWAVPEPRLGARPSFCYWTGFF